MTPIRACGAGDPDGPKIERPFSSQIITNGAELDEVLDVVGKIGSLLGMQASKPSVWNSDVAKFVKLAGRLLLKNETPESLSSAAKISRDSPFELAVLVTSSDSVKMECILENRGEIDVEQVLVRTRYPTWMVKHREDFWVTKGADLRARSTIRAGAEIPLCTWWPHNRDRPIRINAIIFGRKHAKAVATVEFSVEDIKDGASKTVPFVRAEKQDHTLGTRTSDEAWRQQVMKAQEINSPNLPPKPE